MRKIAIAGASGFIGSHLIEALLKKEDVQVVAFSRNRYKSLHSRLEYEQVDLFSLLEVEEALEDCDTAFYLVHSMNRKERLSQGSFSDFDFILADNFARACRSKGVRQIIYVGGLLPDQSESEGLIQVSEEKKLSQHLQSRQEVEEALSSHGVPVLAIRCGLVVGREGSSFQILRNLVRRLPVLVLPKWCFHQTQPVYLGDLVKVLDWVAEKGSRLNGVVEVGGPESLSYLDLIQRMAHALGRRSFFLKLNWIPISLSKLWVRVLSGYPKELVYPLIESLCHEMTVSRRSPIVPVSELCITPVEQAIALSLRAEVGGTSRFAKKIPSEKPRSEVRSVQRLPFPEGRSAQWAAKAYLKWLPQFFVRLLVAQTQGRFCVLSLRGLKRPLMVLEYSPQRSTPTRQLFYVRRGLLVSSLIVKGRLEFRESPKQDFLVAAIHQFIPALPWFIYRWTQALVHRYVMVQFGLFIKKRNLENKKDSFQENLLLS